MLSTAVIQLMSLKGASLNYNKDKSAVKFIYFIKYDIGGLVSVLGHIPRSINDQLKTLRLAA